MDGIIGDSYYDKARHLIQKIILSPALSDEVRKQIVNLYLLITPENAKSTYNEVQSILRLAIIEYNRQSWISALRFLGTLGLISGVVTFIAYLGEKYSFKWFGRNWFYHFSEKVMYLGITGLSIAALGVIVVSMPDGL